MYTSALARTESRGMARRQEFPELDPAQHRRLTVGGLDELWVRPEALLGARAELAAAS
jgi:succinate dehydrogenase/fumarate reductase flavoprotein subunit